MKKIKAEKPDFAELILTTVGSVGVITIAFVAPNVLKLWGNFVKKKYDPKYYLNDKIKKMISKGLIEELKTSEGSSVRLTKKGEQELRKYQLKNKNLIKKIWDKKWRVVIFDVWEKSRSRRDSFRKEIKSFGFVKLQQSVWVYPYDCSEYLQLIKSDLRFGGNVRYMVVSELENDTKLRKHFNL